MSYCYASFPARSFAFARPAQPAQVHLCRPPSVNGPRLSLCLSLPPSLSSIRFPCLLPPTNRDRGSPSARNPDSAAAVAAVVGSLARALGFALVSSLAPSLARSHSRSGGTSTYLLQVAPRASLPLSFSATTTHVFSLEGRVVATTAARVEWAVQAGSKVKYSVILALQQVSWVGRAA